MTALAHDADPQLKGFTLHPPPEDGATAWHDVQQAVDALARGETTHVNLDLQDFADRAHTVVSDLAHNPELLGRFRRLSVAGFFEFAVIDRLAQHLPALWYVGHMQQEEDARPKRLSPKMLADAEQRRRRMHRLGVYHLEHHETEASLLTGMTFVNDQSKLANDLVTLADLYARNRALFARDPHFVAADEADALADSRAIRRARGESAGTEVTWAERAAALYTIVQRDYKELRATGTWMLRDKPDDARARFPPMIERAARRGKAEADDEGAEPDAGNTAPANDAPTPVAPTNDTRAAEPMPAAPAEAKSPAPVAPATKTTGAKKPRAATAKPAAKPARRTSPKR